MTHDEDRNKQPGESPRDEAAVDRAAREEALLALRQMAPAQAPAAVRDGARRAFLHGRRDRDTGAMPEQQPRSSTFTVIPLHHRRSNRLIPFALAASVILMLIGYGVQAPHRWQLTAVVDPDNDLRNRRDRDIGSFVAAGLLETPEHGQFELTLGPNLRLRMAPCSGIVLPQAPRRWNPGALTIAVEHGELFGSTGGQSLPTEVLLLTEELSARITGTTFAVFRIPDASCVCLLEGKIRLTPQVGDQTPIDVPEGSKCLIYKDGRPTEIVPIDAMERMKLQMIRDRAASR